MSAEADRKTVTVDRLCQLLDYDRETGVFTWRVRRAGRARRGAVAGSVTADGYINIKVDGRQYRAHRLAWLYVRGNWPAEEIDHRDGNRANNRFDNLREATNAENSQNRATPKNASSGLLGASWHRSCRRWQAQIRAAGRLVFLGLFNTPEEANAAYLAAKARLHDFQPVPRSLALKDARHD